MSDPFVDHETSGIQLYVGHTTPMIFLLVNLLFSDMDEEYSCLIRNYTLPSTPPQKTPLPTILSPQWFKQSFSRPIMPPALQFRFPLNLVSNSRSSLR